MTGHWIFIIPISIACLMRKLEGRWLVAVRAATLFLTISFYITNLALIADYFCR